MFYGIFYPSLKKIQNWNFKNQKFENRARHINSMLILVQKDIWVQEILLLEVLVMGGGGFKLKVQGTDSYPVREAAKKKLLSK